MIYARKQSSIKPKDLANCYRIMGQKAYIQDDAGVYFYEFANTAELRKLQIESVKLNMASGKVSDWECCDSEGKWSGFKQAKLRYSRMSKERKGDVLKFRSLMILDDQELSEIDMSWLAGHAWIEDFISWLDDEEYWAKQERLKTLSVTTKTINSNFKVGVA